MSGLDTILAWFVVWFGIGYLLGLGAKIVGQIVALRKARKCVRK